MTSTTMPRLTAIGSGKGGTGKTLLAVALAQALAKAGERILLCDADLGLANSAVHLGLAESGDLPSVLAGIKPLGRAVARVDNSFDLLAAPSGSGALANAGALAAENLCAKLKASSLYDRVLIDLGAGVDNMVMRFAQASDEVLLVLTPDPASLTDAYAFAKLYAKANGARLPRMVVNMAQSETEAMRTADAMRATCRAFLKQAPEHLASIPFDRAAQGAVRNQRPLMSMLPLGPAAKAVQALAARLADERKSPPRRLAIAR